MLYLIHASSRTTDGVWILTEPFLQLPASCEDEELGGAVEAALDGSRTAIAHPESWDGISDPLLRMAGVKSWSTFAKSAVCLEIEERTVG